MACSAWPTGRVASDFQFGTASLNASQPLPSGFGISTAVLDDTSVGCRAMLSRGAADATAIGTDTAMAAMPTPAPMALLVRVFKFGSSASSGRIAW